MSKLIPEDWAAPQKPGSIATSGTGTNPYSLAFTYDWLASGNERVLYVPWVIDDPDEDDRPIMYGLIRAMRNEGLEWPIRWDRDRQF